MFLGTLSSSGLYSLDLGELISPEQAAILASGERPVLAQFKDPRPQLAPRYDYLNRLIENIRQDLRPSVIVETLYVYKKPEEALKASWSAEEVTGLFNGILALSTLEGLQYFSASRGEMRTFYETSVVVDGPSTKKPLPDPVYSRPPVELTLYARQKDSTFGDNIYQYKFYSAPGSLVFTQQNLTSLTAGIIPAVSKNNLRSVVAILDIGEDLLVYAASMAKVVSFPGMNDRIGNSFYNRVEAILSWFSDQADKAFRNAN